LTSVSFRNVAIRGARLLTVAGAMSTPIPDSLLYLLERPLFGALGTIRPDDTVQVNPMWFEFDGEHVRFTHTSKRGKFRNLQRNPSMSLMVFDPDDEQVYLEVRGKLVEAIPDPDGDFYVRLGRRYGNPDQQPPPDKADRVVLVMSVERANQH
jgi:PPOX class probable F420-dependent enzyme